MTSPITIKSCEDDHEISAAFKIMQQLRPHLEGVDFVERVRRQKQSGYHLVSAYRDDEMVGVIGYRFVEDLAWERTLYVDDLVVDEQHREKKIGEKLMSFAENEASRRNAESLRLSSGLARRGAHRFYEKISMEKISYSFVKKLK